MNELKNAKFYPFLEILYFFLNYLLRKMNFNLLLTMYIDFRYKIFL